MFGVTKCYAFKIELKMIRKHQDNTDTKNRLVVFASIIKHSEILHCLRVISSPHFSAWDISLPPLKFYFFLLIQCLTHPSPAFSRLLAPLKNYCGPSHILTFAVVVWTLLHISGWNKPINTQRTYYFFHEVK